MSSDVEAVRLRHGCLGLETGFLGAGEVKAGMLDAGQILLEASWQESQNQLRYSILSADYDHVPTLPELGQQRVLDRESLSRSVQVGLSRSFQPPSYLEHGANSSQHALTPPTGEVRDAQAYIIVCPLLLRAGNDQPTTLSIYQASLLC
jgi:hypothetical protein